MDTMAVFEADVENCFPTIPRQIVLDMLAGKSVKEQRKLAWQAAFVSLFVIVTFALFGNALLVALDLPQLHTKNQIDLIKR